MSGCKVSGKSEAYQAPESPSPQRMEVRNG